MSKLSKLKRDPKLFFLDSYKKRTAQAKEITDIILEKKKIIQDNNIPTKKKQPTSKIKNKTPKVTGYRYYLDNYVEGNIQKNLVFFDSFWGRKIGGHPYAIYKAMKSSKKFADYRFIWTKEEGIEIPQDVLEDIRVSFVEYSSVEYASALMRAEILVSNSNFCPYFSPKPEQYVISTWHGIPMKTLGYDANGNELTPVANTQRNFNISDLIVSSSPFYTDKVVKSYGAELALSAVQELGSPRIDLTLNANITKIKKILKLKVNSKVILYAPTWRGKIGEVSNDIEIQIELIKFLEKKYGKEYEILVSLHHLTKKALGNISKLSIKEVPASIDINEILAVCDIVISDYSSIYLDFLCLDRPIILYVPDIHEYKAHRGLYLNPSDLPVNVANNIDELAFTIENPKQPSDFDNYQQVINTLLPLEDGKATQRVVNKIYKRERNTYTHLSDKENILISVGGLSSNGITKSLSNLLNNIDYAKFNIFLLINAKLVDANFEKQVNLNGLNKQAYQILTLVPKNFSMVQKQAYQNLASDKKITGSEDYQLDIAFSREMRRLLGKFVFDHAIDYTGYSPYWTCCIASTSSVNKIVYQHSDMLAEANNVARKFKGLVGIFQKYKDFDKIVSVSEQLLRINKEQLKDYASEDAFCYLPNFLSIEEIHKGAKRTLSIMSPEVFLLNMEKDIIKFVCVARLSPEKGHKLLLHSFKEVIDKGINASLLIIGSGPMEKELKNLSRFLGIENCVLFLGYINNPYPIIAHSDYFILLSEYEGQGLVYLEAMTLGIPCIGSNIPVIKDLITHYGGIVVDLNVESVSNTMIDVATDSEITVNFNAQEYVAESFKILNQDILNH